MLGQAWLVTNCAVVKWQVVATSHTGIGSNLMSEPMHCVVADEQWLLQRPVDLFGIVNEVYILTTD